MSTEAAAPIYGPPVQLAGGVVVTLTLLDDVLPDVVGFLEISGDHFAFDDIIMPTEAEALAAQLLAFAQAGRLLSDHVSGLTGR